MTRCILHVSLDGLHCAIAAGRSPLLRSQPFVVADGRPGSAILDASPEARALGVRSGGRLWEAQARYSALIVVPPDHTAMDVARLRALDLMLAFTPQLLPLDTTETLLDVTSSLRLFGGREALAQRLQACLDAELGARPTIGMAENPLLAKIATHLAQPGGVNQVIVEAPGEALAALPISLLWVVTPRHRRRLLEMGVKTFGQLQLIPSFLLRREFGDVGEVMFQAARGRDETVIPVYELGDPLLAVRHQVELPRPTREAAALRLAALALAERVARGLRERGQTARKLRLCLDLRGRDQVARSRDLRAATDGEGEIARHAEEMLAAVDLGARRCAALELAALDLCTAPAAVQLGLFDERPLREAHLGEAKDRVLGRIPGPALIPGSLEGSTVTRAIA